jgi:hypothetical protein
MEKSWVRRNWWIFFAGPAGLAVLMWIFGEVVMHLWNWLLPMLFGWRTITFWQAMGLLVLCRMLFGGFGGSGSGGPKGRRPSHDRWERMTAEERERFRQKMGGRCANFEAPGEAKEQG